MQTSKEGRFKRFPIFKRTKWIPLGKMHTTQCETSLSKSPCGPCVTTAYVDKYLGWKMLVKSGSNYNERKISTPFVSLKLSFPLKGLLISSRSLFIFCYYFHKLKIMLLYSMIYGFLLFWRMFLRLFACLLIHLFFTKFDNTSNFVISILFYLSA